MEAELTLAQRWEMDEALADSLAAEGKSIWTPTPAEPRWIADDLADAYGPDAPHQDPPGDR